MVTPDAPVPVTAEGLGGSAWSVALPSFPIVTPAVTRVAESYPSPWVTHASIVPSSRARNLLSTNIDGAPRPYIYGRYDGGDHRNG
jgi:hypothetical protein